MKIVIQNGNASFVLCAGINAGENTEALSIVSNETVQPAKFLRAIRSKAIPRGNTQTAISFKITREHADARTCEEFILTHAASIPKSGSLVFTAEGNGSSVKTLSDAAIGSVSHDQIGVTSIHTYQFTGGDFL